MKAAANRYNPGQTFHPGAPGVLPVAGLFDRKGEEMASDSQTLTLVVASELRFLSVARAFIEAACQAARLGPECTDAIVLAVHEAVSNVMRHAHRDHPDWPVQLVCLLHGDRMEVEILDEGDPFDLVSVPHLEPGEMRIGGRGVFLMRSLMDSLSCRPRPGRGNVLHMVKFHGQEQRLSGCG